MSITYEQIVEQMTGPGGPFEIVVETVGGRPMKNFKNRERSLREKIAAAAQRGDQVAIVYGDRRISYGELAALCFGVSARLVNDHGLVKGDRVAVLAVNRPEWLFAAFGATSAAAIGVALNGWWQTDELEYGLNDSGARFLVVDDRLYARVAPVLGKIPTLEKVFYIGENAPAGTIPFSSLLDPTDVVPDAPIDEDDPFMILYTSGTTGRSKGCITTHRGTIAQVLGIIFAGLAGSILSGKELIPASGQAASLLSSPLFHVGGLHSGVCTQITAGVKIVFLEGKFDPERVMQTIEREKITMWPAIPTMLHRVVHSPDIAKYDLSSLRSVSFGGAPTSPETIDRAREVLPVEPTFANAYGLTETHGVATVNGGKDLLDRKTAAGRPAPVLDCKVVDEHGGDVAPGALGEVLFYGPTVTPGYWNRPDATAESVRDGWLHTGDLGYLDADGFLFIVDRAKDMILRGGENVYCVEIENLLAEHSEIDEAAIIGVPDAEMGERVKAIVRRVPGSALDADAVRRHVASRMASFKVPEIVEFTDEALPRNPAGKLLKNELRKL
ncbi:MAG TPA: class I adenylate-forming enzyme family protein [Candidatus Limnocylindrales bacterium]|nr:class I adenylate-forming enzyme family protein [Candidatus Limnocylindrales bacterium]